MKQNQINRAYSALTRLAGLQLPVRDAYNVYKLMCELKPAYEFEIEQERKLIDKYNGTPGENGTINFPIPANVEKFRSELSELNELDVDIDITPVTIKCDSLGEQKITPYEMMNLEGLVSFE